MNKVAMECFYKCRPFDEEGETIRGYRQRMYREWRKRGMLEVVPIVIGALGCITKEFDRWIENLGITCSVGVTQKAALLGTARILRKVLEI